MKIDRLVGIITVLLQSDKVTAPYLAQRFEVSKRTINRDIEDICRAGIPIVTTQGVNGGISIADGYKIDKTLFTHEELSAVFTGLKGLDSISQDKKYQHIMGKFFPNAHGIYAASHILIDLSSHYKASLAPKINLFQQAIGATVEVEFKYYSSTGERQVILEPYLVVFQWSSWYALGYDLCNNEFRIFKLNRLSELKVTDRAFVLRDIPYEKLDFGGYFTDEIDAVILFDQSVKYRLVEEYGHDCYTVLGDGKLRFEFPFTNTEYLLEWVLRFGDKAELLEPVRLRTEVKNRLEISLQKYLE